MRLKIPCLRFLTLRFFFHAGEEEIDAIAASRNFRSRLRERKVDSTVRRSSRITRYKFNARDQSVLYDRLITKYVLIYK